MSSWGSAEKGISNLENMLIRASKTENQRVKKTKKKKEQNTQGLQGKYKWCNIHVMGIPREEKGTEEIFETMMTEKCFQSSIGHQTTEAESLVSTNQDVCQEK